MTGPTDEGSPQISARIGGLLYLIIIALGLFAEVFVRERLLVNGDAAGTARNILAHEQLLSGRLLSLESSCVYAGYR